MLALIDEANLYSIADAIRSNVSMSASIYPSEMVSYVADMMVGWDQIANMNQVGAAGLTLSIRSNAFTGLNVTTASFPMCESIGMSAFSRCASLLAINFPQCVTVEREAFRSCTSLTEASLPLASVVGSSCFLGCTSLSGVDLPTCGEVTNGMLSGCTALVSASVPSCTAIGQYAFAGCAMLAGISVPDVSTIATSAFYGCASLSYAYVPSCTAIESYAFANCTSLTGIDMPQCDTIGTYAFTSCRNMSTITLGGCKAIPTYAFNSCSSLESVEFPHVETISANAFRNCGVRCVSLTACRSITSSAFLGCNGLESLYVLGPIASIVTNALASTPMSLSSYLGHFGSIYVPEWLYSTYVSATNWSAYSSRIVGVPIIIDELASVSLTTAYASVASVTSITEDADGFDVSISGTWGSKYEGVNLAIDGLEAGETYVIDFDLQITKASFLTTYVVGYKVSTVEADTGYNTSALWPDNIPRDLQEHHHRCAFVSRDGTACLSINLCGIANGATTVEIRDMTVSKARWDIADL